MTSERKQKHDDMITQIATSIPGLGKDITFPLCTTASGLLHFSKWLGDPLPVRIYAVGLALATIATVSFINVRYIVYVAMMACRTVQVARPRAFSQDQMAELLSDGADLSLIDYRSRARSID